MDKKKGTVLSQLVSCSSLDLSNLDIPEASAKQEKRHYSELHIQGQNKAERRYVECRFSNVTIEECHFRTLHFERCVMDNVKVVACNVSELALVSCDIQSFFVVDSLVEQCLFQEGKQQKVTWKNSLFEGITFNQQQVDELQLQGVRLARWTAVASSFNQLNVCDSEFNDAGWFNSRLQSARWFGGSIQRQAMSGCTLNEIDYQGTIGSHHVWNDCELSRVNMIGMPLQGASFLGSCLTGCDLSGCNLSYTAFTRAQLNNCRLKDVNLTFCQAEDASFMACDLSGAFMCNARLTGASLSQCRMDAADLTRADLRAAEVSNTTFHTASGTENMRLHGARGQVPDCGQPELLLMRLDSWYQLYQPGIPEASPLYSGKPLSGGSRYV